MAALSLKIGADKKQLRKELARAKRNTNTFARQVKNMGKMIAGAFSVYAVVNFAKTVISKNVEFEKSMADVRAITGATGAEFKRLEEDAKRLGQTTEWTASQVAGLQKEFANGKFHNGEGFVVVSISLDRFKSPLKKAIEEDGLTNALHICDYQGAESSIAKAFKVEKPSNFLIDGDGRLIASSSSINKVTSSLEYLHRN